MSSRASSSATGPAGARTAGVAGAWLLVVPPPEPPDEPLPAWNVALTVTVWPSVVVMFARNGVCAVAQLVEAENRGALDVVGRGHFRVPGLSIHEEFDTAHAGLRRHEHPALAGNGRTVERQAIRMAIRVIEQAVGRRATARRAAAGGPAARAGRDVHRD